MALFLWSMQLLDKKTSGAPIVAVTLKRRQAIVAVTIEEKTGGASMVAFSRYFMVYGSSYLNRRKEALVL